MLMADTNNLALRVTGLGHNLTFNIPCTATVGDVKAEIERLTALPAAYQLLIAHRQLLEDNEATLSSIKIGRNGRFMLLHNKLYAADVEGITTINALIKEMDDLAAASESPNVKQHELVTQICCKLDNIDTHGSEPLRAMRKQALEKAQAIDKKSLQKD
jgi:BAG domain